MTTPHTPPPRPAAPGGACRRADDADERPRFDFMASSHDLAEGLDVRDLSDVTIPGDLVDELFGSSGRP